MELALSNLLANALRYARTQRAASNWRATRDCIAWSSKTTAREFPKTDRASVFRAFTRLDTSRNRETGGFGLGLAIVARVAMLHRGRVSAACQRQPRRRAARAGVAGALSGATARRAIPCRPRLRIALEVGIAAHVVHQRLRRDPAGDQVAGEVHAADHALAREFARPRLQLHGAFGRHVGQQVGHGIGVGRMSAGVGQVSAHIVDAGLDLGLHFVGSQPAEALLGRAHVRADGVLDVFGDLLERR